MTDLGFIDILGFLKKNEGKLIGEIFTDGKDRHYNADYQWSESSEAEIEIIRKGSTNKIKILPRIPLSKRLIAFFGLYSGDGAKGTDDKKEIGRIRPSISFSQREPNLVRFAVDRFREIFSDQISFYFSLGEDSAFFMDGIGLELLKREYGTKKIELKNLNEIRPKLSKADLQYLKETRPVTGTNEEHLAFYYQHKEAMERILTKVKSDDVRKAGITLKSNDKLMASLRRPFKKGARLPGGSSRSDEVTVLGLNGFGELFLKILHEIEDSIFNDTKISQSSLIVWEDVPSKLGEQLDVQHFFSKNPYGHISGERPNFEADGGLLRGKWSRSKKLKLKKMINISPLWAYVSGLYLAEGSTPKSTFFSMYSKKPLSLSLSFTSTENKSIDLVLKTMKSLFYDDDCVDAWKIKVGSQYFPELVVQGIKQGVPMLRGGKSGDGKMRTMEISLSLKDWALTLVPALQPYRSKYSHVEPTGAGIARVDFWASSALCRWFFPLIMYSTFNEIYSKPEGVFCYD